METPGDRFWSRVEKTEGGCWMWKGPTNKRGYGLTCVKSAEGTARSALAHRRAWELRHGAVREGYQIHHRCQRPGCVNPEHLEEVTPQQHGNFHHAKLTWDQVHEIRRRYVEERLSYGELAKIYSMTPMGISHVVRGDCWRVPESPKEGR